MKPEFFVHEKLYDAERESGLPLRLAFAGLWVHCDRNGVFPWRVRTLQVGILPFDDDVDFGQVLAALEAAGFVASFTDEGERYGCIPSFLAHQKPHPGERAKCPTPPPGVIPAELADRLRPRKKHSQRVTKNQTDVRPDRVDPDHGSRIMDHGSLSPHPAGAEGRDDELAARVEQVAGIYAETRGRRPPPRWVAERAPVYAANYTLDEIRAALALSEARALHDSDAYAHTTLERGVRLPGSGRSPGRPDVDQRRVGAHTTRPPSDPFAGWPACSSCDGGMVGEGTAATLCTDCDGAGRRPPDDWARCSSCAGRGELDGADCPSCAGAGYHPDDDQAAAAAVGA